MAGKTNLTFLGIIMPVKKHIYPLIIILVFSFLGLKALAHPGLYTAHDIWHQVARLYYYQRAVSEGAFPPYWIATLAGGLGYPLFIFSYHLPWLLALPILKTGLAIPETIKTLFFISYILSGLAMYFLAERIFKSRWAGLLSGTLYLWAPYRFLTVLVSAQMGIAFVYTFIPILFLGIALAPDKKTERPSILLIAAGVAGIILSHFSSVIATIPATAIFAIAILLGSKDKKVFVLNSFKGFLLGLGLSSFYILPAFSYSRLGVLGFGDFYQRHFVNLSQLIYSKWGYGPITNNAKDGELSFQVGIAQWITVAFSFFVLMFSKLKRPKKYIPVSLLLGFTFSIFMMLDYSLPIWKIITKIIEVDFPFRFMLPAVLTSSLLAGFLVSNMKLPRPHGRGIFSPCFVGSGIPPKRKTLRFHPRAYARCISRRGIKNVYKPLLLIFLVVVALYTNRNHTRVNLYTNYSVKDYVEAEFTTTSMNEYLPPSIDSSILKRQLVSTMEPENIPTEKVQRTTQKLSFEANFPEQMLVSINQFAYPGVTLYIDGQKNNYSKDRFGRVSTTMPQGDHTITVQFEDVGIVKMAKLISVASLVVFLLLLL